MPPQQITPDGSSNSESAIPNSITPPAPEPVTATADTSGETTPTKTFDAASIYPAAPEPPKSESGTMGAASSSQEASKPISFSSMKALPDADAGSKSRLGIFAFIGGVGSFVTVVVFIFAGSTAFLTSSVGFYIQMAFVILMSLAGVVLGAQSYKKNENSALGIVGLAIGAVMLVLSVIILCYYIQIQIQFSKFESQFDSSSSIYME